MTGIESFVIAVLADAGQAAVSKLLAKMVQRQDETLTLLRSLKYDVSLLQIGPFHTGIAYLQEALSTERTDERRRDSVERARGKFMDALGQEHPGMGKAEAALYLSLTWVLLDSKVDARRYALEAARQLQAAIEELVAAENKLIEQTTSIKRAVRLPGQQEHNMLQFELGLRRTIDRLNEANDVAAMLGAPADTLHAYSFERRSVPLNPVARLIHYNWSEGYRYQVVKAPYLFPGERLFGSDSLLARFRFRNQGH